MKIIQKVLIKQVITEKSKAKLSETFRRQKMQLEQECQQLMFEKRKLLQRSQLSKDQIKQRFDFEINERQEKMNIIDFKCEQLEHLDIGSEIVEDEVDALVEVREGMHWSRQLKNAAIVIKDDVIIRIENM